MKTESQGVGLFGLLFLIFVALKLTDLIDWSWWWVASPLWVPLAVGVCALIGVCFAMFVKEIYNVVRGKE